MAKKSPTEMVKGAGKTYFFDVRQAKNGKSYLAITESRIKGEEKIRNSITVFPEDLKDFKNALAKISQDLD